jgi:hypothetical protein
MSYEVYANKNGWFDVYEHEEGYASCIVARFFRKDDAELWALEKEADQKRGA